MTIFETIKARVPITDAAERYGLTLRRNGKALCPFHHDTHPSLSFKDDYFKCFACGEGGDAVKLVQQLTGARKPLDAARILNRDFALGLDIDGPVDTVAARKHQQDKELLTAFNEWEAEACRVWAAWCLTLRRWKEQYAPRSPVEEPDPRFVEACHRLDYAEYVYDGVFVQGMPEDKFDFFTTHYGEVEKLLEQFERNAAIA